MAALGWRRTAPRRSATSTDRHAVRGVHRRLPKRILQRCRERNPSRELQPGLHPLTSPSRNPASAELDARLELGMLDSGGASMRWAIALTCGLLAVALPAPIRAAEANEAAALQAAEAWLKLVDASAGARPSR